jgi:hypothetical protein
MLLGMKPLLPPRAVGTCSEVLLTLALLLTGCGTAIVLLSLATPVDPETQVRFHIDIVDEIHRMAAILNVGLPSVVLSLLVFTRVKFWTKTLQVFPLALASVASVSISACALAVWYLFISAHPGAPLWPMVWWRFWS